jgi:hypothetical protein
MILDLIALSDESRVWIYQAKREFTYEELEGIRDRLFTFLSEWTSHNNTLSTYGNVFHKRFLALFVDESRAHKASGCSIDASVHFIQALENEFGNPLFNRMDYAYMKGDEIHTLHHNDLPSAYENGIINDETLFFDNLVKTKGQFLQEWVKPLKESWHFRFI